MTEENTYIEPDFRIKDDRFDLEDIVTSELVIEVSEVFFRFAVKKEGRFVYLEDYALTGTDSVSDFLNRVFDTHTFLSARFWSKVTILIHSKRKTVAPIKLSLESSKAIFTAMYGKAAPGMQVINYVKNAQTLIYELDQSIIDFFLLFYKGNNILILPAESILTFTDEKEKYINFMVKGFEVVCYLQHFNSYYAADEKLLFNLLEKNKDLNIRAIGEVTEYSPAYIRLKNVLPKFELAKLESSVSLSQYFQDVAGHRYYLLFNA